LIDEIKAHQQSMSDYVIRRNRLNVELRMKYESAAVRNEMMVSDEEMVHSLEQASRGEMKEGCSYDHQRIGGLEADHSG